MTREELALWVADNRKALRRTEQATCICTKSKVLVAVYTDQIGQKVLWVCGRQGVDQAGNTVRALPRAVNLDERAGTDHHSVELAQCAHCRAGVAVLVTADQWSVLCELGPPTRAQLSP